MSFPRQKFREIFFQLVYSDDIAQNHDEDMLPFLMHQHMVTKRIIREAQACKNQLLLAKHTLDTRIAKASLEYAFHRIPKVECNILRVGVFELLYAHEIPPKVAITEAMRLARKYATRESALFVNAILHAIFQDSGR